MPSTGGTGSRDPGDYLDRGRADLAEHHATVEALLTRYTRWMHSRCHTAAQLHGLDTDDVFQLTLLRLLRSSRTADLTDAGVLTWLAQRIGWAATDLARDRHRRGREWIGEDAAAALLKVPAPGSDPSDRDTFDAALLDPIGLSDNQTTILLVECAGFDLSLRELAHLVGRSHAAVRKDKQRAV